MIDNDELGPEAVVQVADYHTGMQGILVVDNTVLGPAGGGARMAPDVTVAEVAALARSMTYKFGILGLPRGGCKSGIIADSSMPVERKREVLRSFGRCLRSYLETNVAAVGPDMGVTVDDVQYIYAGGGAKQLRTGLFAQELDGDPAAYSITGSGVVATAMVAARCVGLDFRGATLALEGFGQVGAGVARRAHREGARVVAVTTLEGGIYNADGIDVGRLLELRRQCGDRCVLEYAAADRLLPENLYFLEVDILVPGARPWVIREDNEARVHAKVIASGGNITMTEPAQDALFRRGIMPIPDFISNSAAALASWVDFLGGSPEQALEAVDQRLTKVCNEVLGQAAERNETPYRLATRKVRERILANRGQPPRSFAEVTTDIQQILGM